MLIGRIYAVYVKGKFIRLIGSTERELKHRRREHARKFGPTTRLKLIREITDTIGDKLFFRLRLRIAEALEVAKRKCYVEDGGLNKTSPALQGLALWDVDLGATSGRIAVQRKLGIHAPGMQKLGGLTILKRRLGIHSRKFRKRCIHPSRESCIRGGRAGSRADKIRASRLGTHVRWHLQRRFRSSQCEYC
jgi:hypothetical protein